MPQVKNDLAGCKAGLYSMQENMALFAALGPKEARDVLKLIDVVCLAIAKVEQWYGHYV
jgi:hypothetical protein